MNTFIFKVRPEAGSSIASHNGQVLDEWTGKGVDLFAKALGRKADRIEKFDLGGSRWTEFIWEGE